MDGFYWSLESLDFHLHLFAKTVNAYDIHALTAYMKKMKVESSTFQTLIKICEFFDFL